MTSVIDLERHIEDLKLQVGDLKRTEAELRDGLDTAHQKLNALQDSHDKLKEEKEECERINVVLETAMFHILKRKRETRDGW